MQKESLLGLKLYTLDEVADKLKVHVRTLRRYAKSGKLKAVKLGRSYKVTEENLKKFLSGE